ncbi:hypothetical protein QR680_015711 [Steinernema hermaphroditum]|uniref:Retrotransposon gag domain-containing protein n=1 Tax=Steinernema hermaphroditum TaxID=289476 RepID=A0AA39LLD2_9BILA|nr:hypothetical protein QR680_015711 [Steinernema hermaphroditum]
MNSKVINEASGRNGTYVLDQRRPKLKNMTGSAKFDDAPSPIKSRAAGNKETAHVPSVTPPEPTSTPKTTRPERPPIPTPLFHPANEPSSSSVITKDGRRNLDKPEEELSEQGQRLAERNAKRKESTRKEEITKKEKQNKTMAAELQSIKEELGRAIEGMKKPSPKDIGSHMSLFPIFSGDKEGKSFHAFYNEFTEIGSMLQFDYSQLLLILPSRLRGDAKARFDILPKEEKESWAKATTALMKAFSPDGITATKAYAALQQKETETVSEFARRVHSTVEVAFSTKKDFTDAQRDRLKLEKFCSGVNKKLGLYLHQAKPKDWKTAIEVAQDYEQWTSLDEEDPVKRLNSVAINLEKAVSTFQEHAANFVTHQTPPRRVQFEESCYDHHRPSSRQDYGSRGRPNYHNSQTDRRHQNDYHEDEASPDDYRDSEHFYNDYYDDKAFYNHHYNEEVFYNHHYDEENPYNDHDDGETFYNGYYEGQDFDTDYYDGALYLYNHNYDREAIDNDYDDEAFY